MNADLIAQELGVDAYAAASVAASVRDQMVERRESFAFETVFSDAAGDKLAFLHRAVEQGYAVVLCFIGISTPELSEARVCARSGQRRP